MCLKMQICKEGIGENATVFLRRPILNPEHLVVLLAGPISHTSTQYIDFVDFLTFHCICLPFILLNLVGVELPLCVVVTLF